MNNPLIVLQDEGSQKQPSHYDLQWLNQSKKVSETSSATYSVKPSDDIVIVNSVCTVTMPKAKRGREISVVKKYATGAVTVVPTGSDTIVGTSSVSIAVQWTCIDFKAIDGGWIII